ncbi:MAG: quinolinate synthase NadA [Rhodospirillaceae bacterium]|nr:MAG: quinolinate synthase NadA [Rhodospirillaceae bacterium]
MNVVNSAYPDLSFTSEVERNTSHLYEKVRKVIPEIEWPVYAPLIHRINQLKAQKNAVILGHNYMTPEIFHCVADMTGDSLALARSASKTDADIIVMGGVHFMAETAKLLNPTKKVLIPDTGAGCTLAESITAEDVRKLKAQYPGVPVITYVNTSAEVKAESDICCTSGNAVEIVNGLGVPRVIMLPDEYLALNTAKLVKCEVITWKGRCVVHEQFSPADIRGLRETNPGVVVLAHPECSPEVIAVADYAGSTAGMIDYVAKHRPPKVVLVTECSMSDNVAADFPELDFVKPCNLCPFMKKIELSNILWALESEQNEVHIDPAIAVRARVSVERMLNGWKPGQ